MSNDEMNVIAECTECNLKLTKSTLNEKREKMMYHNLFENKDESIRVEKKY